MSNPLTAHRHNFSKHSNTFKFRIPILIMTKVALATMEHYRKARI